MRSILFLPTLALFLCACGGSGGNNNNQGTPPRSSSAQQESSVAKSSSVPSKSSLSIASSSSFSLPTEITLIERTHTINEEEPLTIFISTEKTFLVVNEQGEPLPQQSESKSGNSVVAHPAGSMILYQPNEDFFGEDEFYYLTDIQNTTATKVRVLITVNPVADTAVIKMHTKSVEAFNSDEKISIPLPIISDKREILAPDASTTIRLDGEKISFEATDHTFSISIPKVERAGVHELNYQQEYNGELITFDIFLHIKIRAGDITYYLGNQDLTGSLIALVGNDNVAGNLYEDWPSKNLIPLLQDPLLTQYQNYWNVAVIHPAAESKTSLFNNGTTSLRIADFTYYSQFVSKYLPRFTELVVLDGSPLRATGGALITMSIDDNKAVLFHELGHTHAKLGDEYAENCSGEYWDDFYPNVEKLFFGDLSIIQWKHWISDNNSIPGFHNISHNNEDIGVFLGAFYCSDKNHRPAFETLMKDAAAPPSAVDKEAWALANYENMGFLDAIEATQKNGTNVISMRKPWDENITSIKWYLNNIEQIEFYGKSQIQIDEQKIPDNKYSVTAELIDLTGIIRNPNAYAAFNEILSTTPNNAGNTGINKTFKRSWEFEKLTTTARTLAMGKSSPASILSGGKWIRHNLQEENNVHHLLNSQLYYAQDVIPPVTGASELVAEIYINQALAYSQGISLRYFDIPESTNITPLRDNRFYTVIHPAINEPYQIRIYSLPQRELIAVFDR